MGFRMNTKWIYLLGLLSSFLLPALAQAEQEGVVLDAATGNYTITYLVDGTTGEYQKVTFIPATKIDPVVKARYRSIKQGIAYQYEIKNQPKSEQAIALMRMVVSSTYVDSQITPAGWSGTTGPDTRSTQFVVGWSYDSESYTAGLKPAMTQAGFAFTSPDLPGVGVVEIFGAAEAFGFPDNGPDYQSPVGKKFKELNDNNFVRRHVAMPKIVVPNPYNATTVLTGIQKHIDQDLVSMNLIDPSLVTQLDRVLQAAINAANLNNNDGVESNLKTARHLLEAEQKDIDKEGEDARADKDNNGKPLIDKLAARVLAFDIQYVLNRMVKTEDKY